MVRRDLKVIGGEPAEENLRATERLLQKSYVERRRSVDLLLEAIARCESEIDG